LFPADLCEGLQSHQVALDGAYPCGEEEDRRIPGPVTDRSQVERFATLKQDGFGYAAGPFQQGRFRFIKPRGKPVVLTNDGLGLPENGQDGLPLFPDSPFADVCAGRRDDQPEISISPERSGIEETLPCLEDMGAVDNVRIETVDSV
jgi:hypothetical protein